MLVGGMKESCIRSTLYVQLREQPFRLTLLNNGWLIRYIHGVGAQGTKRFFFMERNRKKVASFRKALMYLKFEELNLGNL